MKISQDQILNLWKLKIEVYSSRKTKGNWQTIVVPIITFLVTIVFSKFDKIAIAVSLIICGTYLILIIILLSKINNIDTRRLKSNVRYSLLAILFSVHDLLFLTMFVLSSLLLAFFSIISMPSVTLPIRWLIILLVTTIAVTIVLSPKILNNKSLSRISDSNANAYLPLVISISGWTPSIFVFVSIYFSQLGRFELLYLVVSMLSFSGALLLLPYVILGFYEVVVLAMNKWPRVRKSRDGYTFQDQ